MRGGKRLLDCAGVVTAVFATCLKLSHQYGHSDLKGLVVQVNNVASFPRPAHGFCALLLVSSESVQGLLCS